MLNDVGQYSRIYLAYGFLIFSGNSHFSLSALQKDEDNIFISNRGFMPFLLHHQATVW